MSTRIVGTACGAALLAIATSVAPAAAQRAPREVKATGCVQRQSGSGGRQLLLAKIGGGATYALTGAREREISQYVGQRVEIVGRIDGDGDVPRAIGTSGTAVPDPINRRDHQQPTGATTDPVTGKGAPPGAPVAGRPRARTQETPRLEVVSVRPSAGSCR
jgi:hypothetical protein